MLRLRRQADIRNAICTLQVRGAPAIGVAAAMGLVAVLRAGARGAVEGAAAVATDAAGRAAFLALVDETAWAIGSARPTAVNLRWAMERMRRRAQTTGGAPESVLEALRAEAQAIWDEDRAMCQAIAEHGQALMRPGIRVVTHCNTGALATGGIGTALGIVLLAAERGLAPEVFVDETRPLWQGSRLTAWELQRAGIRYAVQPDSAAATLMAQGKVDLVLVGADRIARNGDVANKLGTLPLAIVARHHGVPFYSVAPSSSFDPACPSGAAIPIEHREAAEVTMPFGVAVAPEASAAFNPAFDVTPAALVTGYVTERGIVHPPFEE
jgi:methylthioribose-1-phosphate isomerase